LNSWMETIYEFMGLPFPLNDIGEVG
jgi:hypothetical protein